MADEDEETPKMSCPCSVMNLAKGQCPLNSTPAACDIIAKFEGENAEGVATSKGVDRTVDLGSAQSNVLQTKAVAKNSDVPTYIGTLP